MVAFWFCWGLERKILIHPWFLFWWTRGETKIHRSFGFIRSESCVRTPDASSAGCTSMPGHGETGVVYVTERDGGGGRPAGRWFFMVGGRSQGFRPRRRRLSLRRGGIAVVAAVRSDPAAVSQCALFFLPHVSMVFVPKDFYFFPLPFPARQITAWRYQSRSPAIFAIRFFSATSAMMMMDPWEMVCACDDLRKRFSRRSRWSQVCADE